MGLPAETSNCHPEFGEFFSAAQHPEYICLQDGKHAVAKAAAAMKNNVLTLGDYNISISYLKNLLARVGRVIVGISEADIEANKDAMDYDMAAKLCQPRVSTLLRGECEIATAFYLELMHGLIKAYISADTNPADRIWNAWYCVFFCRRWKESLQKAGKPLGLHFISRNLHASIEINGHALLLFLVRCRDEGTPELMLVHLAGSQTCEEIYRTLRTMSTTSYTRINFNVKDALESLRKVELVNEIVTTPGKFVYNEMEKKQARHASAFVPVELPDDDEIKGIVGLGNEKVIINLSIVGIKCEPGFPIINLTSPPIQKEQSQPTQENQSIEGAELALVEAVDDLDQLLNRLERNDPPTLAEAPSNELRLVSPEEIPGASEKEKLNFVFFARGGNMFKIPKSTILYMITEKGNPVSVDRLQRFIVDKKQQANIVSKNGRCDKISIGDWVVMKYASDMFYCLVLGFRYSTESGIKRKFRQNFCPVSKPGKQTNDQKTSNRAPDDIELNVNAFKATTGGLLALYNAFEKSNNGFVNIANYFTHVEIERKTTTGFYYIK